MADKSTNGNKVPPTSTEVEAEVNIDLSNVPEEVRLALFHQENRLNALEGLILQVGVDLVTISTMSNAMQDAIRGVRHELIRENLRTIHTKWKGVLLEAEKAGKIQLARRSGIVFTDGKPN